MAYKDFKVLPRRTAADKLLCDKASNTAEYPKYDGYHRGLASMVYKFFEKKPSGGANEIMTNQQLAEELHKPIIRKFVKRKVHSLFIDNIWDTDLANM